ncbi:MAG: tetratricopeptide repeat protein [Chitinophagia bacterium]|jgi:tetratricopeptide (TPR) repeat protein
MSELHQEKHPFLDFVKNNQKALSYTLGLLVIVIAGYFGYTELYQNPREAKAADAMYAAEKYFAVDSSNLVLNGDGTSKGVLYVMKQYSGTPSANLAKYYAGISYYRLNNFNKSIEYLKDFSTSSKQVQAIAYGTIGDAYSELKKNEDAISYYKKAGGHFPEDEAISSEYLFRAASLLELNGKADEAVAIFKDIKSKYPKSEKGFSADKYINRLKVQP